MADAVAEAITICFDDSRWMSSPEMFQTQYDAIKHFCEAKFQEHEDIVVTLVRLMSPKILNHPPTRSLTEILDTVKEQFPCFGELNLISALAIARLPLVPWLGVPDKKTKVLFFVGGLTNMSSKDAEEFGELFRDKGVAVDIVNFYLGDTPEDEDTIVDHFYKYGRSELYEFFNICNCNGDSHFVDVEPGSDIRQLISDSLLKKTPCLSEKRNDNVKELDPSCRRSRRKRSRRGR